jgi:hypothetical protein
MINWNENREQLYRIVTNIFNNSVSSVIIRKNSYEFLGYFILLDGRLTSEENPDIVLRGEGLATIEVHNLVGMMVHKRKKYDILIKFDEFVNLVDYPEELYDV